MLKQGQRITLRGQSGVVTNTKVTPGMVDVRLDGNDFDQRARVDEVGAVARKNPGELQHAMRKAGFKSSEPRVFRFLRPRSIYTAKSVHPRFNEWLKLACVGLSPEECALLTYYIEQNPPTTAVIDIGLNNEPGWGRQLLSAFTHQDSDVSATIEKLRQFHEPSKPAKKGSKSQQVRISDLIKELATIRAKRKGDTGTAAVEAESVPILQYFKMFQGRYGNTIKARREFIVYLQDRIVAEKTVLDKISAANRAASYKGKVEQEPDIASAIKASNAGIFMRPDPPRIAEGVNTDAICGNFIDGMAYYIAVSDKSLALNRFFTWDDLIASARKNRKDLGEIEVIGVPVPRHTKSIDQFLGRLDLSQTWALPIRQAWEGHDLTDPRLKGLISVREGNSPGRVNMTFPSPKTIPTLLEFFESTVKTHAERKGGRVIYVTDKPTKVVRVKSKTGKRKVSGPESEDLAATGRGGSPQTVGDPTLNVCDFRRKPNQSLDKAREDLAAGRQTKEALALSIVTAPRKSETDMKHLGDLIAAFQNKFNNGSEADAFLRGFQHRLDQEEITLTFPKLQGRVGPGLDAFEKFLPYGPIVFYVNTDGTVEDALLRESKVQGPTRGPGLNSVDVENLFVCGMIWIKAREEDRERGRRHMQLVTSPMRKVVAGDRIIIQQIPKNNNPYFSWVKTTVAIQEDDKKDRFREYSKCLTGDQELGARFVNAYIRALGRLNSILKAVPRLIQRYYQPKHSTASDTAIYPDKVIRDFGKALADLYRLDAQLQELASSESPDDVAVFEITRNTLMKAGFDLNAPWYRHALESARLYGLITLDEKDEAKRVQKTESLIRVLTHGLSQDAVLGGALLNFFLASAQSLETIPHPLADIIAWGGKHSDIYLDVFADLDVSSDQEDPKHKGTGKDGYAIAQMILATDQAGSLTLDQYLRGAQNAGISSHLVQALIDEGWIEARGSDPQQDVEWILTHKAKQILPTLKILIKLYNPEELTSAGLNIPGNVGGYVSQANWNIGQIVSRFFNRYFKGPPQSVQEDIARVTLSMLFPMLYQQVNQGTPEIAQEVALLSHLYWLFGGFDLEGPLLINAIRGADDTPLDKILFNIHKSYSDLIGGKPLGGSESTFTVYKTYNPYLFEVTRLYWQSKRKRGASDWHGFWTKPNQMAAVDNIGRYGVMFQALAHLAMNNSVGTDEMVAMANRFFSSASGIEDALSVLVPDDLGRTILGSLWGYGETWREAHAYYQMAAADPLGFLQALRFEVQDALPKAVNARIVGIAESLVFENALSSDPLAQSIMEGKSPGISIDAIRSTAEQVTADKALAVLGSLHLSVPTKGGKSVIQKVDISTNPIRWIKLFQTLPINSHIQDRGGRVKEVEIPRIPETGKLDAATLMKLIRVQEGAKPPYQNTLPFVMKYSGQDYHPESSLVQVTKQETHSLDGVPHGYLKDLRTRVARLLKSTNKLIGSAP